MPDQLFSLAGLATLGWLLLILLPGWRVTRRLADLEVFPVYLAVLYLVGIVPLLAAAGPGVIRDFGNADGVANLLARRDLALVAWIHILVFDQLVGVVIYRDNMRERYLPLFVQSLILLLTFLFGPVGYLAYTGARLAARRRRTAATPATETTTDSTGVAAQMRPTHENVTPGSALRMLADAWLREPALFAVGLTGLALGAVGLAAVVVRGRIIPPEGDLTKAASFDVAVGIFVLTIAVFTSLVQFTQRGGRLWRATLVGFTLVSFALENIQIARGIDPRFTQHGSIADKLGGAFFLLVATGLLAMFAILFAKVLRNRDGSINAILLLATRYGCAATAFGFVTGYLMSGVAGAHYGAAGNILPLHALGFHSLQAIPLVALFCLWSHAEPARARRSIHLAGLAWMGVCLAVAWQMFAGRSPLEPSAAMLAAAGLLLVWLAVLGRSAMTWLAATRLRGISVRTPQSLPAQSR